MKELQQATLNELKSKTEMPDEMAAWLCRQKLVLEEKLAKRRALAELSVS